MLNEKERGKGELNIVTFAIYEITYLLFSSWCTASTHPELYLTQNFT